MSFKRGSSKVWWGSESLEFHEVSSSPGSQDSGFSDTESNPSKSRPNHPAPTVIRTNKLFKNLNDLNLCSNYKEKTTPVKESLKQHFYKHSPLKVNRNLFNETNQYSSLTPSTVEDNDDLHETSSEISSTKSLPTPQQTKINKKSSVSLPEYVELCASTLDLSDFDQLDGFTASTPKSDRMLRLPRPKPDDNRAVKCWLDEARLAMDLECTTTLQTKSISADLQMKVNQLAACSTTILRGVLSMNRCIEIEYRHRDKDPTHLETKLMEKLLDFLNYHTNSNTQHEHNSLGEIYTKYEEVHQKIVDNEIKQLVSKLEDPTSELDLRATLTGVTSVSLRNQDLIPHFIKADIVPILLILCERSDGSSLRTQILRALSTMCSHSCAIMQFEKFSGIQLISDILEEPSRPEPERSEAVTLLAQVTAPWLNANYSLKGLEDYTRRLVKSLNQFVKTTNCCQNLLLCLAALVNLTTIDNKSIKYLVQYRSIDVMLMAVASRGRLVSTHLLEQVATLLANMASTEESARKHLQDTEAPDALVHFLNLSPSNGPINKDVERRLQQKCVIALSRLCSDRQVAEQVVRCGGVKRLVQLCREKRERFSSDAVLVAALATLRKIAEACGKHVLNIQDYQELVDPKLLDSFLAYSTQNESYV